MSRSSFQSLAMGSQSASVLVNVNVVEFLPIADIRYADPNSLE
jgi:hypothetical protein